MKACELVDLSAQPYQDGEFYSPAVVAVVVAVVKKPEAAGQHSLKACESVGLSAQPSQDGELDSPETVVVATAVAELEAAAHWSSKGDDLLQRHV